MAQHKASIKENGAILDLHPRITEALIRGIRIPIADYELVMQRDYRSNGEYIFRKIRRAIENEVIMDWRRVLATDTK